MRKLLNSYVLPNSNDRLSVSEIQKCLTDFEYFMGHYAQIIGKDRKIHPFKLNAFQKYIFSELIPFLHPDTRLDKNTNICFVKSRQVGCSVGMVGFINYVCAFLDGFFNTSVLMVEPVADTVSKLYNKKIEPILTGVHPDLMPTMERETLGNSIITHYKDIKGKRRNNYFEVVSSGASSVRSDTINISIFDECLSGDVEILTDQGFKRLDSLDKTELVAQYDLENDGISFVKPLRYIDKEYNGDAFEWTIGEEGENGGIKFVSTARHDFVAGRNGAKWHSTGNKFKKVKAWDDCFNSNYVLPTWGLGVAEHKPLTPIERLGIATQADGSVIGTRNRVGKRGDNIGWTRCRLSVKRQCKIRRMEKLLNESGIKWKKENTKRENYATFCYDLPYENPKLLSSFLAHNCSYERAREILHEVLHWDGNGLDREVSGGTTYLPKTCYYSSVVKENRDFVASIALQCGFQCSAGVQVDNRSDNYSDVYRLYMMSRKNQTYECYHKKEINYNGRVYCVTVPSGCIVVKTGRRVWVCGNCAYYAHPEVVTDAAIGSMPDYGFSLTVYMSTYNDMKSDFFKEKLQTAIDNPDDWKIMFAPWFILYPEVRNGMLLKDLKLTDYDKEVIIPEMEKFGIPEEEWGDCIDWYHRKKTKLAYIQKEFPTTLQEVMEMGANKCVFSQEALEFQKQSIETGKPYRFITDNQTGQVEAQMTDHSPFKIYRKPIYGHKYILVVDPIMSTSDDSDLFAASVFDQESLEQVATFRTNGLDVEDYADYMVSMAKLYNRAIICPERNVAEALVAMIRANGYYNFYYEGNKAKGNRDPGIRTTASSKEGMIDKLNILLNSKRLVLHDKIWVDELGWFERRLKKRNDGTELVRMMAKPGKHDDTVTTCFIFAASLDQQQLTGQKRSGFAII